MSRTRDLTELSEDVICSILRKLENRTVHSFDTPIVLPFISSAIWFVEQGAVSLSMRDNEIDTFAGSDIIGPWLGDEVQAGSIDRSDLSLVVRDSGTRLIECSVNDVEDFLSGRPACGRLWSEFLCAWSRRWCTRYITLTTSVTPPTPQYRHYPQGAAIIEEGSLGEEVFVLKQGLAAASVEGTFVGEVKQGEIFGALSVLTDSPRGTSVIAKEACDCAIFSGDAFKALLRTHPELFDKFLSDLARVLRDVNLSVSKTSNTAWRNLF